MIPVVFGKVEVTKLPTLHLFAHTAFHLLLWKGWKRPHLSTLPCHPPPPRPVPATEALRLGAYAAGLVARSSAVTLTTLEGAPYPPPPEAETRWDWTAQTATVCRMKGPPPMPHAQTCLCVPG